MAHRTVLECVDRLCRQITRTFAKPFGGIPFVGVGDFRQVAPVVKGGGATATLLASIKSSPLWKHFVIRTLHQPIRSAEDPKFTEFVDHIGEDTSGNRINLDSFNHTDNMEDVADFLFPQHILENPQACLQRAFLSPRNIFVDEFNSHMLTRLPGDTGKSNRDKYKAIILTSSQQHISATTN